LEKQVQLKIKGKRRLVDKSWLWRDEINHPNHQAKNITTHKFVRTEAQDPNDKK
jgi:hypothetical protein